MSAESLHSLAGRLENFADYYCFSDSNEPMETIEDGWIRPQGSVFMHGEIRQGRWRLLACVPILGITLVISSGCTLHRNLLLRWHLEFDANSICDDEVPASADHGCRCDKCSRLGRPHAHHTPTPAELGHARFHPVPRKPVFPSPDGGDMADMGPPAPQWYMRQHEPLFEKGRIKAEPSVPDPSLEEVEAPPPPMPNSGWDVSN